MDLRGEREDRLKVDQWIVLQNRCRVGIESKPINPSDSNPQGEEVSSHEEVSREDNKAKDQCIQRIVGQRREANRRSGGQVVDAVHVFIEPRKMECTMDCEEYYFLNDGCEYYFVEKLVEGRKGHIPMSKLEHAKHYTNEYECSICKSLYYAIQNLSRCSLGKMEHFEWIISLITEKLQRRVRFQLDPDEEEYSKSEEVPNNRESTMKNP